MRRQRAPSDPIAVASDEAAALRAARAVDGARLWQRHVDMARLGAMPGGGVNRQALSREEIEARRLLAAWAAARGFGVAVDGIGNLFVRRAGRDAGAPPVLSGSHMDTQPAGGRFDGIYGVLAALEALEALEDAGIATERPIEAVAWTNEEGSRFAPGTMGSMVFTGQARLEDYLPVSDAQGVRVEQALAEALAATPGAAHREFNTPLAAYVETHIEQGPRLEAEGVPIGAVTGIQGSRWFTVEVAGEAAHAGTAPLRTRRDALQSALAMIGALNELTRDPDDVVRFTVGSLQVTPDSPNVVPSHVRFTIDLRHPDAATLARLGDAVAPTCERAAGRCTVRVTENLSAPPSTFDERIVATVERAAQRLELGCLRLPSGAFHDAQFLNRVCPTGMIFVPCEKGISHSPAENAKPEDLAAGARVLAAVLTELAGPAI